MTYKSDPVPLPTTGKFHILKKKYVYWYDKTQWNKETRVMKDNRVLIGRLVPGDPTRFFPNEKYEKILFQKEVKVSITTPGNTATQTLLDGKTVADFMRALTATELLATSQNKQDYEGLIRFCNAPLSSKASFSVRSELGNGATLISASNNMNSAFAYRLCHKDGTVLTKQEAMNLEQKARSRGVTSTGKKLICFLRDQGIDFDFIRCMGTELEYNLRLDSDNGDLLIAALLLEANTMREESTPVPVVIDHILQNKDNATFVSKRLLKSLKVSDQKRAQVLSHRFKTFLLNFLRGAEVSKKWDGRDSVNGGFIIVTSKAEGLCLDIPTRNSISDYLFNNVFFETPSIKRLLEEKGNLIFELNGEPCVYLFLQIRSMK